MGARTAAIIVIGNEILTGRTQDANASFLTEELYRLGVALRQVTIIPDDLHEIEKTVRECSQKYDLVFTSGGIGPTHDDLTIEGVARAFHRSVVRDPELASIIRRHCGEKTDEARLRMADTPAGAELVRNESLRWPVVVLENVYILPGVPEIFRSKFLAIRERFRTAPLHCADVLTREDEFDIAPRLHEIARLHPDVSIGSYPACAREDYRVRITIESSEAEAVERARSELVAVLDPAALVPADRT